MKNILNLHNFGKFEILGEGLLNPLSNDGRFEFYSAADYENEDVMLEASGWGLAGLKAAKFNGVQTGFVIKDLSAPSDYGYYIGADLTECLEEYFRLLSENGLGIAEI